MLGVEQFGRALITSGDLDPVYIAIHNAPSVNERIRARLVLAYWCFYHLGLAARLAEIKDPKKYWEAMMTAAINEGDPKPYPRGGERRHYRGAQAVASMASLISRYKTAEDALYGFYGMRHPVRPGFGMTFKGVSEMVRQHRGFGEWMAFKIADMGERVLGLPIDFSDCALGIYKDPREGAAVAYTEWWEKNNGAKSPADPQWPWMRGITDQQLKDTVAHLVFRFKHLKAPPRGDRPINVQEVETVLCKYKSHLKGHYPLGKDTLEIGHGLEGWGDLAQELKKGLPKWPPQK